VRRDDRRPGHHGALSGVRVYLAWHDQYDDPGSSLSRRLSLVVRDVLRAELDARSGPVRALSLCAGDGRDVLEVLAEREDAARVSVTMVEVLPGWWNAREVPPRTSLPAWRWLPLTPAARRPTRGSPRCGPGATLVWSRGRSREGADDFVLPVRNALSAVGFTEVSIRSFDVEDDHTALGVVRFDGSPVPLGRPETWFTLVG
jgi:hypothetical protein